MNALTSYEEYERPISGVGQVVKSPGLSYRPALHLVWARSVLFDFVATVIRVPFRLDSLLVYKHYRRF